MGLAITESYVSKAPTFTLGDAGYGVDIPTVQENRGDDAASKIASAPNFIKDAVNLHAGIVPIIDLRARSGLAGQPMGSSQLSSSSISLIG